MNIERLLDLSTAHLSPAAKSWLSECATENHAVGYHGSGNGGLISTLGATAFGYFMHAPEGDKPSTMPDELYAICKKARAVGCGYILFDRDADVLEGLPTYNEDGDIVDLEAEFEAKVAEPDDAGIADEIAEPGELDGPDMSAEIGPLFDLLNAAEAILPDIESEIEQRKTGGNDEDWQELDARFQALHAAVHALTR